MFTFLTKGDGSGELSKESIVTALGTVVASAAAVAHLVGYDIHVDPQILGSVGAALWFLLKFWQRRRAAANGQ